jgi:hypothetical protein
MVDWVYQDGNDPDGSKRAALRKTQLVKVCSHLANGAKHFKTDANRHKSVSSMHRRGGLFGTGPWFGSWFGGTGLFVELAGDAAAHFGQSIGAIELAEKVLDYWEKNPDNHPGLPPTQQASTEATEAT